MYLLEQILQMSRQDVEQMDPEHFADLSSVSIEEALCPEERVLSFIRQTGNPYCFFCGNTPVRIQFTDGAPELEALLQSFFTRLKQS